MFKFIGLSLISFSVVLTINKKLILSYFTYVFITEAVIILENMKTGCMMGKTYTKVFSQLDYSAFKFFVYGTEYRYKSCLSKQRIQTVDRIFSEYGQRVKASEIEFLNSNISILNNMAEQYRHYIDANRKTQLISSVSLVLILTIVVV